MPKITPFLWFDGRADEAIHHYASIFKNAQILDETRNEDGTLFSATIHLEGHEFIAFNGGPHFPFTPAFSMFVACETQEEVDRLWASLTEGGQPGQCGWLTDRFGLSWQVAPQILPRLLHGDDEAGAERAMAAMLKMTKLDIAKLEAAYRGE